MGGHWTDNFSFSTGAVRTKDIGCLVLTDDNLQEKKIPHSGFVVWQLGKWFDGGRTNWNATSTTIIRKPKEQLVALGEFGNTLFLGSGDRHEEQIKTMDSNPEDRGPLRCVRLIGSHLYVAGMDRQVYRRDGINHWLAIDKGMRPKNDSEEIVGFESIDGFSEKEIYCAGWEGEIWSYNGTQWHNEDSPTNLILTGLCCGEKMVYACGRQGLLLEGRKGKWRIIDQDIIQGDIWGMAWYRGALFLSTMDNVYRMLDGNITVVEMGKDEPETCYHLSAADGVLWSIGAKDVMAFDGNQWTRID